MVKKKNYIPYDEAKSIIFGVAKTRKGYIRCLKAGNLPEGFPYNPDRIYSTEEYGKKWVDWAEFLGTKIEWLEYKEAEAIIFGIANTSTRYFELFRSKQLPKGLPSDPNRVYDGKGWDGWFKFLHKGARKVSTVKKNIKPNAKIEKKIVIEKKEKLTQDIIKYFCKTFKNQGYTEIIASIRENFIFTNKDEEKVKECLIELGVVLRNSQ